MTDPSPLFDEFAADYEGAIQSAIGASGESVQFFANLRADLIAQSVGAFAPTSILDFGCGIGNLTRAVARRFPATQLVGTDLSERSLREARRLSDGDAERIQYVPTHEDCLPFFDQTFDVAFTNGVFHHINPADRAHWAVELHRVLRPGGILFVFEHNPYNPLTVRAVRNIPFDRGVVLLTARYSKQLLRAAGFTVAPPTFYFFFPRVLRVLRRLEPLLRRVPIGSQYFVTGRS